MTKKTIAALEWIDAWRAKPWMPLLLVALFLPFLAAAAHGFMIAAHILAGLTAMLFALTIVLVIWALIRARLMDKGKL